MDHTLECTKCGFKTRDYSLFRCRRCNSVLEVRYDYSKITLPRGFRKAKPRREKYLPLLPIDSFKVKLDDGGTPLVKKKISGIDQEILFKMETENPTHSFKDRGSSVEISRAVELGFKKVCCGSTGNMGISIAKYSEKAGIDATVFISKDANPEKMKIIRKNGASIAKVKGGLQRCSKFCRAFFQEDRSF